MPQPKAWVQGIVRFECQICLDGYAVRPPTPTPPRPPRLYGKPRPPSAVHTIAGGYNSERGPVIVALGSSFKTRDVPLGDSSILLDLLQMEESAEGAIAFAREHGLLWRGPSTPLDEFYEVKRNVAQALKVGRRHGFKRLAQSLTKPELGSAQIRTMRTGELRWYVRDLVVFLWLAVCRDVRGAAAIVECTLCKTFFGSKPKGPNPYYCSNKCRQAAWRVEHREAVNQRRRERRAMPAA